MIPLDEDGNPVKDDGEYPNESVTQAYVKYTDEGRFSCLGVCCFVETKDSPSTNNVLIGKPL